MINFVFKVHRCTSCENVYFHAMVQDILHTRVRTSGIVEVNPCDHFHQFLLTSTIRCSIDYTSPNPEIHPITYTILSTYSSMVCYIRTWQVISGTECLTPSAFNAGKSGSNIHSTKKVWKNLLYVLINLSLCFEEKLPCLSAAYSFSHQERETE